MKVFIENESGSDQKNIFDEKTLEYQKTVTVSRAYPYPYGFILDTTSGDGDNVDCFIITHQRLSTGQIVECEPIGLMEQVEDGKEDHNVLVSLIGEHAVVDTKIEHELSDFVSHVFDHLITKKVEIGRFLGREEALRYTERCK